MPEMNDEMREVADLAEVLMSVVGNLVYEGPEKGIYDPEVLDAELLAHLQTAWTAHVDGFEHFLERGLIVYEQRPEIISDRIVGAGLVGPANTAKKAWLRRLWDRLRDAAEKDRSVKKWLSRLLGVIKSILKSLKGVFGLAGLGPWAEGVGEIVDLIKAVAK